MQFKLAAVAALLASVASPALASPEGTRIATALKELTTAVNQNDQEVQALSMVTMPQKFSSFVSGYQQTLHLKNEQVTNAPQRIATGDEPEICDAYIALSEVEKAFLYNVIGKYDLFKAFGFEAPLGALLHADESVSDALFHNVIDLVPSCQKDLQAKGKEVRAIFERANTVYGF